MPRRACTQRELMMRYYIATQKSWLGSWNKRTYVSCTQRAFIRCAFLSLTFAFKPGDQCATLSSLRAVCCPCLLSTLASRLRRGAPCSTHSHLIGTGKWLPVPLSTVQITRPLTYNSVRPYYHSAHSGEIFEAYAFPHRLC